MSLNWRLWLRLTRPGFLSITTVALVLGSAVAAVLMCWRSQAHRLRPAIVLTIAATTVHGLGMALGRWAQAAGMVL